MSKIEIEHGIPIPEHTLGRSSRYRFAEMKVGDSLFDEGASRVDESLIAKSARQYFYRNKSVRFLCRKVEGGVRIWRIE